MKALDVMCAALNHAKLTGSTSQVPTQTQLVNLSRGNFGKVETIRVHGRQGVLRFVCTHGILDFAISAEGMKALEVLYALDCNPPADAVAHVERVEMGDKDDYGGAAEFKLGGSRQS